MNTKNKNEEKNKDKNKKLNFNFLNKKDSKNKKDEKDKNSFSKNFFIAFMVFLLVSAVFSLFSATAEKQESITLSQLANEINESKVLEVVVVGSKLNITLKENNKKHRSNTPSPLVRTTRRYG